jgi:cell division protease FtsH
MAERLPPPKREINWGRVSRTVAFWALLIVGSVALVQLAGRRRAPAEEIDYTEFLAQVEQNNVASVEIVASREVRGEFRRPVSLGEPQPAERFLVLLPYEATSADIANLRAHNVEVRAREAKQPFGIFLLNALPILLIIGFFFFIFRQMQAGGNRAFAFGKSRAKLLTGDTPKITFADVAGCEEAKQELQEIIEFLKDPQKFQRLGGRLPKGALLVGAPGTGKTLLAKAVAGEAGRPFFSMSGSDFVEMFVGVGASRVRDLFEQGKAHAPCIIFIDEIDAVGRHRGAGLGGGHDEREQTLNQLLVEMDGFDSKDGVILVAATNRPDVLDPALLRPGRFDRQIVVDMPDVKGREAILRVHSRKIPLAPDVELASIARGTPGFSGADLANLVNEAALLAARRNKNRVEADDLEDAKDKVVLGVERKSLAFTEEERRLTAYHEAGHALVHMNMPGLDPLHKVTIVPRGRALGVTWSLPEKDRYNDTKEYLKSKLAMSYGGRVAEELVFGPEKITTGAFSDIRSATEIARRMVSEFGMSEVIGPVAVGERDEEIFLGRQITERRGVSEHTAELVDTEMKRILNEAFTRAREILQANLPTLHALATTLLDRETLDGDDVKAIIEGRPLPPKSTPQPVPPPAEPQPSRAPGALAPKPVLGNPPPEPAGA